MKACFSETSVDFRRTTWRYIPQDNTLHNHRRENIKSYIIISGFNFKFGKERWSKTVAADHSLHDESNGNGVQQRMMMKERYFHIKVYLKEHGGHQRGEQLTRQIM
jgi:hypothetical protein